MTQRTRNMTFAALFGAAAIVMPILFHGLGLGSVFTPMFLPLLTMGFFVLPAYAGVVGFLSPWISAFLTGMPPLVPIAPIMSVEGAALAGTASFLYQKMRLNFWLSLLAAIASERIVLLIAVLVVAPLLDLPATTLSLSALTVTLPGIALQMIIVPILVKILERHANRVASS